MTETATPGPLPDNPVRYGAMQYVAPHILDDPPVLDSLGRHLLLEVARRDKRVLVGEVEEVKRVPVVFVLVDTDDGMPAQQPVEMGSVLDTSGKTTPDAYLLVWHADTTDRIPDPDPVRGVLEDDPAFPRLFRGRVDEQTRLNGGQVIFRHGIDGEAIIRAYNAEGQAMSYLFAVEIERGEHQLEVHPGTASLTAETDPDHDDPDDTDGDPA